MVDIPLGKTTYRRREARTAEVAMVNVLVEPDITNQVNGQVFIQRPSLSAFGTAGDGPGRGILRRFGVLQGLYYTVSGQMLYGVDDSGAATPIGAIPGNDVVQMAGSIDRLIIVANGVAWSYNGSAISMIVMPDGVAVSSVAYIKGYFILVSNRSQRFYWLAPGDVDPDPLNFASVESSSDNVISANRLLDEIWFFSQQTTEVWHVTGNADAPFEPLGGRLYEIGAANRDSIVNIDNSFFWVANDLTVRRAATSPEIVSDNSVAERLRENGAENLRAWGFQYEGHSIYSLRIGQDVTLCFDIGAGSWPSFKSFGQDAWRAHLGTQVSSDLIVCLDDSTGNVWRFDSSINTDAGSSLERIITGGLPIIGPPQKCANVSLYCSASWAEITGEDTNPVVAMRYSEDGGNNWSSWLEEEMGPQGTYAGRVVWRGLGIMQPPGRIFQFRVTDNVLFRASYARLNDEVAI